MIPTEKRCSRRCAPASRPNAIGSERLDRTGGSIPSVFFRWALWLAVLAAAFLFFGRAQPLFSNADGNVPRGATAFWPLLDPGLYAGLWGIGIGGCAERFVLPLLFSLAFLTVAYLSGRLVLGLLRLSRGLSRPERLFFALAAGLAVESFVGTALAATGALGALVARRALFLGVLVVVTLTLSLGNLIFARPRRKTALFEKNRIERRPLTLALALMTLLFLALYILAGTFPPYEYDMLEYHAQAAREIVAAGRIDFFPHNAYMNMPLGAEMFLLWGEALCAAFAPGRFFGLMGVCCGKTLLAGLAPITALGLYAFSRRFFHSRRTGIVAAFGYLAFPGVFQTFACGLNDGALGLAAFACFYAVLLTATKKRIGFAALAGLFAGFAVSIKYTGVVFVALPAFVALAAPLVRRVFQNGERTTFTTDDAVRPRRLSAAMLAVFFVTATAVGGYWYVKNACFTGNPVWPLCYGLFGDSTGLWNDALNERWTTAHSPHGWTFSALGGPLAAFTAGDAFASPFFALFGILVLALIPLWTQRGGPIAPQERRFAFAVGTAMGYALFFVVLWLAATHRLLRFLDPVAPILALLVAAAFVRFVESFRNRWAAGTLWTLLIFSGWYALVLDATASSDLFAPLSTVACDAGRYGDWSAEIARGNFSPTDQSRLLLVGEARAFAYRVPIEYSTCWNRSPLIDSLPASYLARRGSMNAARPGSFDFTRAEADTLAENLARRQIGYLLVDYGEIDRFNATGNYGLCDADLLCRPFFESLEKAGVLEKYRPEEYADFSARTRNATELYRVNRSGTQR